MRPTRRTVVVLALAFAGGLMVLWTLRYFASGADVEIVAAEYGVPGRTCTAGADVMKQASAACGGHRARCLISVSSGWCGDPAPGVVKTLTVDYMCGTTRKRASGTEGTGVVLTCP
jgi:hypothetical protein